MNIKKNLTQALLFRNQGRLLDSYKCYEQVLKKNPYHEESIINGAIIKIMMHREQEAETMLDNAYIKIKNNESLIKNLILLKIQLNKYNEANLILEKEKKLLDEKFYIQNRIRILRVNYEKNQIEIENLINLGIKIYIDEPNFLILKGLHENYKKDYESAYSYFKKLEAIRAGDYETYYNLGITLNNLKKWEQAKIYLQKSIKINNKKSAGWLALGFTFRKLKNAEESENAFQNAIELNPQDPNGYYNLALAFEDFGKHKEAKQYHQKAINIEPNYYLAHFGMGEILLKEKNWSLGFEKFKWRIKTVNSELELGVMVNDFDIKDIDFTEKLEIVAEGGIGDEILFARILDLIDEKFHQNLIVYLDSRLKEIYKYNYPKIYFQEKAKFKIDKKVQQINMGTLPNFIIKKLNERPQFKNLNPLLKSKEKAKKELNELRKTKTKLIGIAWKSKHNLWGESKSISLAENKEILKIPGIKFINLQYGDCKEELKEVNNKEQLLYETKIDLFNDIEGLYGLIDQLDLVVTTSNVTAHIAGSLGKKTILLLPVGIGRIWYWSYKGKNSYWYPSVEIINQTKVFTWTDAITELKKELDLIIKNH